MVSSLKQVTPNIVLAANAQESFNWLDDVTIVADKFAGVGGLAGVQAALSAAGKDASVLVVAWDMPFVSPGLLQRLVIKGQQSGALAVIPESYSPNGVEPFCALYSTRVLDFLTDFLERGGGPAKDFLSRLPNRTHLTLAEVERIGDPRRLFFSVNTADDLARANTMALAAQ